MIDLSANYSKRSIKLLKCTVINIKSTNNTGTE